jgi:hypothetical protein
MGIGCGSELCIRAGAGSGIETGIFTCNCILLGGGGSAARRLGGSAAAWRHRHQHQIRHWRQHHHSYRATAVSL